MRQLATIGYEGTTLDRFLETLTYANVEVLADVRAVANSRRPGFSKKALAAAVEGAGMQYVHLRPLGTPADGRAAARAGRHQEMRRVFLEHMATPDAHAALESLADIVTAGASTCLMCYEAEPAHCHRTIIAELLDELVKVEVKDLRP